MPFASIEELEGALARTSYLPTAGSRRRCTSASHSRNPSCSTARLEALESKRRALLLIDEIDLDIGAESPPAHIHADR